MAETAEQYFQRLAGYIEGKDPLTIQRQTAAKLSTLSAGLSAHELTFCPAAGKWSIVEILAHLAEDEMPTGWRYRQMIERDGVPLAGFDQELWAKLGTYSAWDRNEAVALFRLLREANLRGESNASSVTAELPESGMCLTKGNGGTAETDALCTPRIDPGTARAGFRIPSKSRKMVHQGSGGTSRG
jgi:DinB superfamily